MTRLTNAALTAACFTLIESSPAQSPAARRLAELCTEAASHHADSASRQLVDVEAQFAALVQRWREESRFESSTTKLVMHPAYQQIIGMGEKVVPLLLREMARRPSHWSWALQAITGANPIKREDAGRLARIAAAWVQWGRARGFRC